MIAIIFFSSATARKKLAWLRVQSVTRTSPSEAAIEAPTRGAAKVRPA